MWKAFAENRHHRAPVRFNTNPRMVMLNPDYNPDAVSYEAYFHEPATMAAGVFAWQYWMRHFLPGDHEHGLPEAWQPWFDIQNTYDATWLGCDIFYRDDQVPDTLPLLNEDNKYILFDNGIPDPMSGEWPQRALDFYHYCDDLRALGWEWLGRPIGNPLPHSYIGNDGIFTAAATLRGATHVCEDILADPDYVHTLLQFLYEAFRTRMRAWREYFGIPIPCDHFALADDAIQYLSEEQYREFVLPWHVKLYGEFATHTGRTMHLCGNVQRHFVTLRDTCEIDAFDTGFPIDFTSLRHDLGPDVLIYGGPPVALFMDDNPKELVREAQRICASGVLEGGRFVFQEANNLPPCASLDACEAFYQAIKTQARIVRM